MAKRQRKPQKRWVFDPDSGGVKIPDGVKRREEAFHVSASAYLTD